MLEKKKKTFYLFSRVSVDGQTAPTDRPHAQQQMANTNELNGILMLPFLIMFCLGIILTFISYSYFLYILCCLMLCLYGISVCTNVCFCIYLCFLGFFFGFFLLLVCVLHTIPDCLFSFFLFHITLLSF